MINTTVYYNSNRKVSMFVMILWFMITVIIPIHNVLAQGTYYVGGTGASNSNPGTSTQPFATIKYAASVAGTGSVINIRAGTYRETITPANSGITFQPDQGAIVTISGLNEVGNTGWTVHNGSIYKKTISLPINGYSTADLTESTITDTTIIANQIFKDGAMQFEAQWPNRLSMDDLFDQSKLRHITQTTSWTTTQINDSGIPTNMAGGKIGVQGWFIAQFKSIIAHSGTTITIGAPGSSATGSVNNLDNNMSYNRYYFVFGKLGLLDAAKEWFYDGTQLYYWQTGGATPTGIEYKKRNWGFDLRGKSNITILGLHFIGCDPVKGNNNTSNVILDNIRAKYMNHSFFEAIRQHPGFGNAKFMGSFLTGSNNTVRNSEFYMSASTCIWLGENGRVENNLFEYINYEGNWGAPVNLYGTTAGQKILQNSMFKLGRGALDFGPLNSGGSHANVEFGYNYVKDYGMNCWDLGATYGHGGCRMDGLEIHHNWIASNHAPKSGSFNDPGPPILTGSGAAFYFDQGSGPRVASQGVHHNVTWDDAVTGGFHETSAPANPGGAITNWWNNTFSTSGIYASYTTYDTSVLDVQRNNIYRDNVNILHGAKPGNIANSLLQTSVPTFVGGDPDVIGGLAFRLTSNSLGRNTGATSFTGAYGGVINVPVIGTAVDIGAYDFDDPNPWVAGYVPLPQGGVPVTGVSISPSTLTIAVGATSQLSKTIAPANATNQNVTWTTSNASVATVNSVGMVTAVAVGTATITVTTQDGSFTATSSITVNAGAPVTTIDNAVTGTGTNQHNYTGAGWVHGSSTPTFYNSTLSFSTVANNSVTLSFVGNKIEWYTEKLNTHGIAAVSIDNGTEVNIDLYSTTGVQQVLVYTSPTLTQGTHTFKIRATGTKNPASSNYYTIHDFVKVYSGVPVTGVSVSPATASLVMGSTTTVQLTKTISPANATNQNVTWSTSDANVATVNSTGLVTAIGPGSATITVTTQEGSFTATSAITVHTSVTTIDNAVTGTGTNQHNYTGAGWVHGSSTPTFYNSTLSFSTVANNAVTLSFVGNKIEWYTEKLNTHGIAAVSIDNGTEVSVDLYSATGSQQLLVYTSPLLTQGAHTFKIRATGTKNPASSNFYTIHDFVKVYSGSVPVTGVTVSPSTAYLVMGSTTTAQLTKTITPANATNQNVTWSTSNANVATVNSSGLVTAVGAGNATITVTTQDGSFQATSAITVNTVTTIDNAVLGTGTNQHNYVGAGWVHGNTTPTFFNSTLSFSAVTNNSVTLSFVGNKIEWYTEKINHHGIAAVSIDNGSETNIDLYSSSAVQQLLVYTSPPLTQGSHTFKIRTTGTKNAASSNYYVIHDFVKVYSSASGGGGGQRTAGMDEETEIYAYPNPINAGDILSLELPNVPGELNISDMVGKTKYTLQATEQILEIPTKELTSGMYLLFYRSPYGVKSVKIIIK